MFIRSKLASRDAALEGIQSPRSCLGEVFLGGTNELEAEVGAKLEGCVVSTYCEFDSIYARQLQEIELRRSAHRARRMLRSYPHRAS